MTDIIEKLSCGSLIQHGLYNDRIYLLKASEKGIETLSKRLIVLAMKKGYGKIFLKVKETHALPFIRDNYAVEARIPGLYSLSEEGIFLAYYLKEVRRNEKDRLLYEKNLKLAQRKQRSPVRPLDADHFMIRLCTEGDVYTMKKIYEKVFPSYPFPIHDTDYLLKTMHDHVDYFCVETAGKIIALSSAEKDIINSHAEMTDFATLPEWRGNGLAIHLLKQMENKMKEQGIHTLFTIARAASAGMNITFSKAGYRYAGRLKNNTNISGKIESMNIWYRSL